MWFFLIYFLILIGWSLEGTSNLKGAISMKISLCRSQEGMFNLKGAISIKNNKGGRQDQ